MTYESLWEQLLQMDILEESPPPLRLLHYFKNTYCATRTAKGSIQMVSLFLVYMSSDRNDMI